VDSDTEDVSMSSRGRRRKVRKIESDSEHVDKVEFSLVRFILWCKSHEAKTEG
jgi:hypothetical protein